MCEWPSSGAKTSGFNSLGMWGHLMRLRHLRKRCREEHLGSRLSQWVVQHQCRGHLAQHRPTLPLQRKRPMDLQLLLPRDTNAATAG